MRVWFLKETKTIDVNCGTGCNITIGSRENVIYRITPRENNDVNSVWLPDSHRLNFKYLARPDRLKVPTVKGQPVDWRTAIAIAVEMLKAQPGERHGADRQRAGNERRTVSWRKQPRHSLGIRHFSTSCRGRRRRWHPDLGGSQSEHQWRQAARTDSGDNPGEVWQKLRTASRSGSIKCVISLGEDLYRIAGFPRVRSVRARQSSRWTACRIATTAHATVVLPARGLG